MKQFLLIFPLLLAIGVNAQDSVFQKRSKSGVIVHGGMMYHLNNKDVQGDGDSKFLSVKNSIGYQVGLSYEYTTRRGFTITPNVTYGFRNRDVVWNFSFEDFDSTTTLPNETETFGYYSKENFFTGSLLLGYNYRPKFLKTVFQVKGGIGLVQRFQSYRDRTTLAIAYEDSYGMGIIAPYAQTEVSLGQNDELFSFRDRQKIYSLYFGIKEETSLRFIKDYRLGIQFMHSLPIGRGRRLFDYARADYYNAFQYVGAEVYSDRFTSMSLIASITF